MSTVTNPIPPHDLGGDSPINNKHCLARVELVPGGASTAPDNRTGQRAALNNHSSSVVVVSCDYFRIICSGMAPFGRFPVSR